MKRILLVDHPQFTSATYFLWHGLKELEELYPDHLSVSCYPYIPTNYDEEKCDLRSLGWFRWLENLVEQAKKSGQYPYGIPAFQPTEGLTSLGETIMHRLCSWRRFPKKNILDGEDAAVLALESGKFDMVVLGNSHRVPTLLLSRLKDRVAHFPPLVYLDAGERDEFNEHWVHVFRPDLVFKQILTPAVKAMGLSVQIPGYTLRMYPLPLSSPLVGDPGAQIDGVPLQVLRRPPQAFRKILPLFYALGSTWPERALLTRAMDEIAEKNGIVKIRTCSYLNYHLIMAQSRMAITMRGSGRDTNHYWEIPMYRTAMIADGTMGCIHPYPFEDRKTALFYRSIPELVDLVKIHLPDEGQIAGRLEAIAEAGQEHLERYHSTAARAVFFLDILGKEIGFLDDGLRTSLALWKGRKRWDGRPWEGPVV